MKTLQRLTILSLIFFQTIGYGQEKNTETISKNKKETTINIDNYNSFIGKYIMEEANFELEIIRENDKMFIVTEFSKDLLLPINKNTLQEYKRGVDLELIKGNKNALKFSQNGYETIIERVKPKTKK